MVQHGQHRGTGHDRRGTRRPASGAGTRCRPGTGGCHCRRVRFEVDAPAVLPVIECNSSICRMTGPCDCVAPLEPARRSRWWLSVCAIYTPTSR